MAIIASIISTFDPRGLNNARKSFSALTDANVTGAKKQQLAMKLAGGAAATAAVAAGAFAVKIGVDGVKAALADEKSLSMLNKTLTNVGEGFRSDSVNQFIDKLMFTTGIADDELRPALNRLVLATGSVTEAQSLLTTALDVSAGTGKDLESVSVALSKAAGGQTTALSRLGVGLDKTILATGDLDKIQGVLNQKFSGQSSVAANTYAGRLEILKRGVDEAKEAFGYGLLDAIDNVSKAIGNDASGLAEQTATLGEYFGDVARGAGEVTATLIDLAEESSAAGKTFSWTYALPNAIDLLFGPLIDLTNYLNGVGEASRNAEFVPKYTTGHQARIARENKKILDQISIDEEARKSAEAEAEKRATEATRERERVLKDLETQQKRLNKTSEDFASFVGGTSPKTIQGSMNTAKDSVESLKKEFTGLKGITESTADRFGELSGVIKDELGSALSLAESQLESARESFNQFRDAISGSITAPIDFATAIENQDFIAGLEAQADTAIKFSDRIKKLLEIGLSEKALKEVLDAGAETGIAIADQIIAGGSTVVQKVNTLVASVESVANVVGTQGAKLFYDAGLTQGQALVDGIKQAITDAAAEIASLAASLGSVSLIPPVQKPAVDEKKPLQDIKNPPPSVLTKTEKIVKAAGGAKSDVVSRSYTAMAAAMGRIRLADGGVVMGPTNALIGEAGPEAVIPLSGANSVKMGTTYNITVNAGIGTNGAQVGREIVDAIKKFERTSGPVFASA